MKREFDSRIPLTIDFFITLLYTTNSIFFTHSAKEKEVVVQYIKLPDENEIERRLIMVNNNRELREGFYPLIAEHGSRQMTAGGIATVIRLAIHKYANGNRSIINELFDRAPLMIQMIVDDTRMARKVKEILASLSDQEKFGSETSVALGLC